MCERERDYLEVIRRGLKTDAERKMVRKRKKGRSIDKDIEEKKEKKEKVTETHQTTLNQKQLKRRLWSQHDPLSSWRGVRTPPRAYRSQ